MLTRTEENYIKAVFKIAEKDKKAVSTNALAALLATSAASVTDMLKRLAVKDMVIYEKYRGVILTPAGNKAAIALIRRHRLWETFLVGKLRFGWHQVHDIAEQLEHIDSEELMSRLDAFLDYPKFDPHGDPIPNAEGKFTLRAQIPLIDASLMFKYVVLGVKEHDEVFLKYLNSIGVKIGSEIRVMEMISYDKSLKVLIDGKNNHILSAQASSLILVRKTN
jgi:DtxR family Mn-dependent transcriptional regulator